MSAKTAVHLRQLDRRAKVVELARAGKPYRVIASEVGCDLSTVQLDLKAHWAENKPDPETVEQIRN